MRICAPRRASLDNWLDRRQAAREFRDRDPDVIVIGAGQSGLMMAARLGQLNISTLVVDKSERIGDVWRKRYRSLTLHNEICMNHFAYMPFPDTWPVYIPKDKLADWLEFYAESMELNVWTKTVFLGGEYDSAARRWTVRLSLADGSTRTMRPRHVIMAVGVSGIPSVPELKGADDFEGIVLHSSGQSDDLDVNGKRVLVVGAGTSGHDIAQDMHLRGAEVTMLQRSPITVVSLEPSSVRAYEMYRKNEGIRPLADTDFIIAAVPYDLLRRLHGPLSRQMAEEDKELLDGLRKVGFLLDNGEDDTGYFLKLLRYQAGYYLNVGASDLIIEGKIKLKAGVGDRAADETASDILGRQQHRCGCAGARDRLSAAPGGGPGDVRRRCRRPCRPDLGHRRRRRTAKHVCPDGSGGVLRRRRGISGGAACIPSTPPC